jgi:protein-disulfide isomerase
MWPKASIEVGNSKFYCSGRKRGLGKSEGTQKFKTYAQQTAGINVSQFNQCLDEKKYSEKVNADKQDAENFGVSGTPTIFVGDQLVNSGLGYPEFKRLIDESLAK